jgi:hypothetical protein
MLEHRDRLSAFDPYLSTAGTRPQPIDEEAGKPGRIDIQP